MRFFQSLLIFLALVSPAFSQDGPHDAARAKDAAQALKLYLDGVSNSGGRPDYSKPPASGFFQAVFDTEALAALPPPTSNDLAWLRDWSGAARETLKLIIFFGAKPGPAPDQAALARNLTEYEDQYAAATSFAVRIHARQVTALSLFINELPPDQQHLPAREAGRQLARDGAARMIGDAIVSVSQGAKPVNARLVTAAIRDTRDAWATFIPPNDRARIVKMVRTNTPKAVNDDEVQNNLAAVAAALAAVK